MVRKGQEKTHTKAWKHKEVQEEGDSRKDAKTQRSGIRKGQEKTHTKARRHKEVQEEEYSHY
jgi:hypothetical protein